MRSLFAPRPRPYYIFGFNYRRSSAGIRVMHMLCDALIRSGHEAYIAAEVFSPDLMTPKLTDAVIAQHRAVGVNPIAVYPEVVDGNPLNCGVVVRYLLNKPGFIAGNGEYGENDLFFAYKHDFMLADMPRENHLFLPAIDSNIFRPSTDPTRRVPGRICYYLGHKRHAQIDPHLLPADAIEITLDYPDSWQGLADIFQQCEYLYLGEASGLGYEAALCGCVPVLVSERWSSIQPDSGSFVAFGMDPGEIARVRDLLPGVRDMLEQQRAAFWPELDRFIRATQAAVVESSGESEQPVIARWLQARTLTPVQQTLVEARKKALGELSIAVVLFDPRGDAADEQLTKTLSSLGQWSASNPGLCVRVVSAAAAPAALPAFVIWTQFSGEPVGALNQTLLELEHEWLLMLSAGDELLPAGTLLLGLELVNADQCRMLYADTIYRIGDDQGPAFRPDFNLDYFLSFPAGMSRNWIFRREIVLEAGGFDSAFAGALEFELIVRMIEQGGTAGIGHISEPLLVGEAPSLQSNPDEVRVLKRHLQNRGYEQGAVNETLPGRYHLVYGHSERPLVSILVPTKDQLPILRRCIESLLELTSYPHYEVIVIDNNSETPDALQWLAELERIGEDKVRVLRYPEPFNFAAINNAAADMARGSYLVLLNNDTAIISPDWLDELLNHAQRPEVGIVGAKLLYPDKRIQHAGVVLGLSGPADHPFIGEAMDEAGYMQRLQVDQNYSAVTAACLMIRKSIYYDVGGMDAEQFKVSYNDVDLCLKVGAAGYLTVWTPHAVLMHEGSVSQLNIDSQAKEAKRKRFVAEQDAMYAKWLPLLARDPAYNPNLSLVKPGGFKLADVHVSWRPLSSWKPLPAVLVHPADKFGCGNYRVIQPFTAMQQNGLADGCLSMGLMPVTDLERFDPDSIILQRQIGEDRIEAMRRIKAFSRAFKVYELDDYLPNLPMKNAHREHMPRDILKSLRRGLGYVDRFVVSTAPLAEAFAGLHSDIRIVENRLPVAWWGGLQSARRVGGKPRVGWAGGLGHAGDLEMIADVVKELAGEVEWVFFGMCPDKIRPYVKEVHQGVSIEAYPAALARLNLDLALAPVEQNLFNECKSNLRLLEYGACGFPVICSDVRCYAGDLPVTRVKNRFKDWVNAIRMHLADLDATARMGDELRTRVLRDWMLDGENLTLWRNAWLAD